jgi:hypothetical protein
VKRNSAAVACSKELVPKVLRTMEGLLEQVCGFLKGTSLKGISSATP